MRAKFISCPVRIMFLIVSVELGVPWVHASDRVRVARSEQASRTSRSRPPEFLRLEMPSGDRIDVASGATIIPRGQELQVDDQPSTGQPPCGSGRAQRGTAGHASIRVQTLRRRVNSGSCMEVSTLWCAMGTFWS